MNKHIVCSCCGKEPKDIRSCVIESEVNSISLEEFVKEDGTFCMLVNSFVCDDCYYSAGAPSISTRELAGLDKMEHELVKLNILNQCRKFHNKEPYII